MNIRVSCFLAIIIITGLLPWRSAIATEPNIIDDTPPPQIQVRTIEVLPYGIKAHQSKDLNKQVKSGIYYDIANQLMSETGYSYQNEIYPYARIMLELKSGQTDITIMFKYNELAPFVTYVAPLPTLKNVVIGLKGAQFDSIEQLKGIKLAYLRGAKFSEAIDSDPQIIRYRTLDFVQAVRMLIRGHVDAVIGPMDPILSAALQLGQSQQIFGEPLIVSERTPWIQVSNKSLDKLSIDTLKIQFNAMEKRGDLERIRNQYVNPMPQDEMTPTNEVGIDKNELQINID